MLEAYVYLYKKQKMLKTETVYYHEGLDGSEAIIECLDDVLKKWDLGRPIIMSSNAREFESFGRTIFKADDFMESFPYDRLELEAKVRVDGISEEDDSKLDEIYNLYGV